MPKPGKTGGSERSSSLMQHPMSIGVHNAAGDGRLGIAWKVGY